MNLIQYLRNCTEGVHPLFVKTPYRKLYTDGDKIIKIWSLVMDLQGHLLKTIDR